jgi:peptidyl-prolyl cis-trans isomerase SurA
MKTLKIIIFTLFSILSLIDNANTIENKILFRVNNEIITSLDIFYELRYLQSINEQIKNTEKKQAFEIAKNSLIREKIKEIELKKTLKFIEIEDKFLNDVIIDYFKKKQIKSISDFNDYFSSININPDLIKKKITIEVLWNQLIFKKYNSKIKINRANIVNDLKKNNKQKEYLLFEILFNINENEKLERKFNQIKDKIKKFNFSEAALIFSTSNSSNKGGELGWIKETSMNKKISNLLKNIKIGDYSNPIVIPGGFLILKVADVREIKKDYDLNEEIEKTIKDKTNEQLNQFSNIFFNKIKKNISIDEL